MAESNNTEARGHCAPQLSPLMSRFITPLNICPPPGTSCSFSGRCSRPLCTSADAAVQPFVAPRSSWRARNTCSHAGEGPRRYSFRPLWPHPLDSGWASIHQPSILSMATKDLWALLCPLQRRGLGCLGLAPKGAWLKQLLGSRRPVLPTGIS